MAASRCLVRGATGVESTPAMRAALRTDQRPTARLGASVPLRIASTARGQCRLCHRRGDNGSSLRRARPIMSTEVEGSSTSSATNGAVASAAEFSLAPGRIVGIGGLAPTGVVTNTDLAALVDTNDEWITTRTGISERHVLAEGESMTDLTAEASRKALAMAGVNAEDLDLVLMCTSTPDDLFGGACKVQAAIGASNAVAFDLTAACSGFILGMITAFQFIKTGSMQKILVIGADALSRYVDWQDRKTCILFGDGTGAVVIERSESGAGCSLLGHYMKSDGSGAHHLFADYDASDDGESTQLNSSVEYKNGTYQNVSMNGQEVFKFAVRAVPDCVKGALKNANLEVSDVDWLICHQANQRILDSAADRLKIPREKVISNLASYGNTSAASIPLAMAQAVEEGKIKDGDIIAVAGFGAGLTWGAAIFKWGTH